MTLIRTLLTLAFLLWSLLLLGSSGLIGWIGDGLGGLLAQVQLSWLASAAAGIGKALLLFVWIISAVVFAFLFMVTGSAGRSVSENLRGGPMQPSAAEPRATATVTLERAPDGSYQ